MSFFSNGKGLVFLPHGQKKMKQLACGKCADGPSRARHHGVRGAASVAVTPKRIVDDTKKVTGVTPSKAAVFWGSIP